MRAACPRSSLSSSRQKRIHEDAITVNGKTIGDNCRGKFSENRKVIKEYDAPLKAACRLQGAAKATSSTRRS